MKKLVFVLLVLFSGCGTVRYQIIADKDAKPRQQLQWDVIEVNFNNFYRAILGREGGKILK
jgi:uncharacterized protein YceK